MAMVVAVTALAVRLVYLFVLYDGPASVQLPDTELW